MQQIIAIGGGGFYRPKNLLMEQYFLNQTGKKNPRICFIPTASGESDRYIVKFYEEFGKLECRKSHLSLFNLPTKDLSSYLLEQDAIYVGGGNTRSMLALWHDWGVDTIVRKAWDEGIVLGGVSAGSICWFEEGITDSIPGAFTRLKCLGFLEGSNCPHFDSEEERRPTYHKMLKNHEIKNGYAADDHVALHFQGQNLYKVVSAMPHTSGFELICENNNVIEETLDPELLK